MLLAAKASWGIKAAWSLYGFILRDCSLTDKTCGDKHWNGMTLALHHLCTVWKIKENVYNLITAAPLSFAYVNNAIPKLGGKRQGVNLKSRGFCTAANRTFRQIKCCDVASLMRRTTKQRLLCCLAAAWLLCEPLLKPSTVLGSPFVSLYSLGSVPPLCLL